MTHQPHVQSKGACALNAFNIIARLAATGEGLRYQALSPLFQTYVVTISEFGGEGWWNRQVPLSNMIQLTQNEVIRKMAGAFVITPTAALEAETCLAPTAI